MPPGKYLLADAGFGTLDALLVPYRGVQYHLKEWCQANLRPQNREELFNLRHAALRNVIERIFGVLKCQFHILQIPPKYDMHIQAQLPVTLCAIHNFIRRYDPEDFFDPELASVDLSADEGDEQPAGILGEGPADAAERRRADQRRDAIAQEMWDDYQRERVRRGL
ncbi:hypothetical protein PAXRUDRAFT_22832 [Paxillus rubicundulus Ve08.2h10]|uniref:DDE Tnp4 domain-containing protein n=1 Tax=Paxillus rubicundulus Ve08.2h10 TaxID=930991 RepID=A0A0D0CWU2_9AGAM|nr:hypothetical protein PAXRUDRAFT_22832 [Paxillus rubicundulus Ve08.2h10]